VTAVLSKEYRNSKRLQSRASDQCFHVMSWSLNVVSLEISVMYIQGDAFKFAVYSKTTLHCFSTTETLPSAGTKRILQRKSLALQYAPKKNGGV
jgi:hypothetical protein